MSQKRCLDAFKPCAEGVLWVEGGNGLKEKKRKAASCVREPPSDSLVPQLIITIGKHNFLEVYPALLHCNTIPCVAHSSTKETATSETDGLGVQ